MPFTLIKGAFFATGYSPDGDSVKFKADDKDDWKRVKGRVKMSLTKGHVQLRFEGIDALETHYRPSVRGAAYRHQPLALARAARDFMLSSVGIKNVVWGAGEGKVISSGDGVPGYILSREVDSDRYGRPVSFVFAGSAPTQQVENVFLTPQWLKQSVNYRLLAEGLAYPTYYRTLFYDLRDELSSAVKAARASSSPKGLWKQDGTGGFTFSGESTITDDVPILPKLFRRLIEHLALGGALGGFKAFLESKKDGLLVLPQANHTDAMDAITEVSGSRIGLTVQPENIVFDPQL